MWRQADSSGWQFRSWDTIITAQKCQTPQLHGKTYIFQTWHLPLKQAKPGVMSPALNRNHFYWWYDNTLWPFTLHLQFRCQKRSEMKSSSPIGKNSAFQLLISVYRPEVAFNAWFMIMADEMFGSMVFVGSFIMLITLHCNILYIFPPSTSVITCLVPKLQLFYASYLAHFHLKQTVLH